MNTHPASSLSRHNVCVGSGAQDWAGQSSRDAEKGTDPSVPAIPNVITFQFLSRLSLAFPATRGAPGVEVFEPISRVLAKL